MGQDFLDKQYNSRFGINCSNTPLEIQGSQGTVNGETILTLKFEQTHKNFLNCLGTRYFWANTRDTLVWVSFDACSWRNIQLYTNIFLYTGFIVWYIGKNDYSVELLMMLVHEPLLLGWVYSKNRRWYVYRHVHSISSFKVGQVRPR